MMTFNLDDQFDELRKEFLLNMDEDLDQIEALIISDKVNEEDIKEIFRKVHSLKGAASSHELPIIGSICHYFEDYITSYVKIKELDSQVVDTVLKYIDLLNKCRDEYQKGVSPNYNSYLEYLSKLNILKIEKEIEYKGKVLIVDSTSTMSNFLKKGLKELGYDCYQTKNGLSAFNRLVTEKFDAVISSLNLEQLDGVSLVTAVKSTNNINANISTIIISASSNIKDRFPRDFRPDALINKDTQMIKEIEKALEKALQKDGDDTLSFTNGPEKIIYVEDDPRMQKLFQLAMKKHPSVQIEFTTTIEETVRKCKSFKPDLLLLDNFLKGFTGKDVFDATIQFSVPTIFLTASEGAVDTASLQPHREYLGIITKPFRPSSIYGQICRFYKNR